MIHGGEGRSSLRSGGGWLLFILLIVSRFVHRKVECSHYDVGTVLTEVLYLLGVVPPLRSRKKSER